MAFVEQVHINDVGTIFRVTVYDTTSTGGTTVADISSASTKTFTFKRPDGTTFDRTAVFTVAGVDGDLDVSGTWNLQAYVATPAGNWNTSVGTFKVHENL